MKTFRELDKRQRALVKLCREVPPTGEAKLDLVLQDANFAGLTTALRSEELASRTALKYPALALIETAKRGVYRGLQHAAARFGTSGHNYIEVIKNMVHVLSSTGGGNTDGSSVGIPLHARRAVCLCFDHAGAVPSERIETVYRVADETAYRLEIAVRVLIVITKVQAWDAQARRHYAAFPKENELLKPRWRAWSYGASALTLVKAAAKFDAVDEGAPLLEQDGVAHDPERLAG